MSGPEDRRTRIADAVLVVLGERGGRGLTHRAVDEQAGLPPGSTSYYLRSRADLLAAAVPRLAQVDLALLAGAGTPLETLTRVVRDSLHGPGRLRTLARYELVLESARRPELRAALAAGTERLLDTLLDLFPTTPLAQARVRARDLLAFVDGLLLANVIAPEAERRSTQDLVAALARYLEAVPGGDPPI